MADSRSRTRRRGERREGGHRHVRRAVCGNTVVVVVDFSPRIVLDKDGYFEAPHANGSRAVSPPGMRGR
jgi:hypothetical protein